jgi:hypothetical protein
MNIFSEEFKAELSSQLEEITNIVKKDNSNEISDLELIKAMEHCFNYSDCDKEDENKKNDVNIDLNQLHKLVFEDEKKIKKKKIKVGDVVYLGDLEGEIVQKKKHLNTIKVLFDNDFEQEFTLKGQLHPDTPVILAYFPTKIKIKKIKY